MPDETTETADTSNTETAATETQSTETQTAEPAAPETFELTIPENAGVDKESLEGYMAVVNEQKLSKEHAQAVFNYMLDSKTKFTAAQTAETAKSLADIKADKDIGGTNYDAVQASVDKLALKFGGVDFQKQVGEMGLKNDPLFLHFIRNINSVMTEDKAFTTNQSIVDKSGPQTEDQKAKAFFNEKDQSIINSL